MYSLISYPKLTLNKNQEKTLLSKQRSLKFQQVFAASNFSQADKCSQINEMLEQVGLSASELPTHRNVYHHSFLSCLNAILS
jgi:hypothetical protein